MKKSTKTLKDASCTYSRKNGWVTSRGTSLGSNTDIAAAKLMQVLTVSVIAEKCTPGGNWNTSTVETLDCSVEISADGQAVYVRGSVHVKNWRNYKCSGQQSFCYAVFVGDSGHVYTHRAPATKGWMEGNAKGICKRLRKLGIGATLDVIQQGDYLLKPANGSAHPDEDFAHERMGSGHHNFELPQLYHRGQFWIKEQATLIHTAIDGIQHPDVRVPPGKWIVGTTASQLDHSNARD